jgi:hypothetical protein
MSVILLFNLDLIKKLRDKNANIEITELKKNGSIKDCPSNQLRL